MRLYEGLCAQTQGLIHATGQYMDHCFLPQGYALPARELELMDAYESPCNMETLFWGRTDPITGNLEPKMVIVVLAPWTFKSGHLVEFHHGAPVRPRPNTCYTDAHKFSRRTRGESPSRLLRAGFPARCGRRCVMQSHSICLHSNGFSQLLRTCVQLDIHYWVVTNYNEFTFGSFSEREWRAADGTFEVP